MYFRLGVAVEREGGGAPAVNEVGRDGSSWLLGTVHYGRPGGREEGVSSVE